jgi:hypothetical protein
MEEKLKDLLASTNSDRVILYKIEPSTIFASQQRLFQIKPHCVVCTEYAKDIEPIEKLYSNSFHYHNFADAIRILFSEDYFSYIPGIDNRISDSCNLAFQNLCTDLEIKSACYFLVNDIYIVALHNCRFVSLIKKSHIQKELSRISNLL